MPSWNKGMRLCGISFIRMLCSCSCILQMSGSTLSESVVRMINWYRSIAISSGLWDNIHSSQLCINSCHGMKLPLCPCFGLLKWGIQHNWHSRKLVKKSKRWRQKYPRMAFDKVLCQAIGLERQVHCFVVTIVIECMLWVILETRFNRTAFDVSIIKQIWYLPHISPKSGLITRQRYNNWGS